MKLSSKLVILHSELIQGRYQEAGATLCDLLELVRLHIRYPDETRDVMYTKLETLVKAVARKNLEVPELREGKIRE